MLRRVHELTRETIDAADWTELSDAGLVRVLIEVSIAALKQCSACGGTQTIFEYGGPFTCGLCDENIARRAACHRLLHRGLTEASRRALTPTPDHLRVAWDRACTRGEVNDDALALTLVEIWARLMLPAALGPMAARETALWLAWLPTTRATLNGEALNVSVGIDGQTVTFSSDARTLAEAVADFNDLAQQARVPVRFSASPNGALVATVTNDAQSSINPITVQQFRQVANDCPASPPVGRRLAQRLERGRPR